MLRGITPLDLAKNAAMEINVKYLQQLLASVL